MRNIHHNIKNDSRNISVSSFDSYICFSGSNINQNVNAILHFLEKFKGIESNFFIVIQKVYHGVCNILKKVLMAVKF